MSPAPQGGSVEGAGTLAPQTLAMVENLSFALAFASEASPDFAADSEAHSARPFAQLLARAIDVASAPFCRSRRSDMTTPMSALIASMPMMTPPAKRTVTMAATAPWSRGRRDRANPFIHHIA